MSSQSVIRGAKKVNGTSTIKAAVKPSPPASTISAHICVLDNGTSVESLTEYLNEVVSDISITKCEKLKSRAEWYSSFKVDVNSSADFDVIASPQIWPEDTVIRKFVPGKRNFLLNQRRNQQKIE